MMNEPIASNYAAESGHWYYPDGRPAYTIIGKSGKERPTTLRDAKKFGLLPSVTEILKLSAKPGLVNWQIDQAIKAALTLPRIDGENDDQLLARIKADAQAQAKQARERGTQIHAWVQEGFEGRLSHDDGLPFYRVASDAMNQTLLEGEYPSWICEKSFAYGRFFGGKGDLHNPRIICDIKTTDKPLEGLKLWDEHIMQLAAYKHGLDLPSEAQGAILFIHSMNPAARLIFAKPDELERGWRMFNALVDYFYAKTGL